ncbi:Fasciclin-like arabinogalactan protein 11 [Glycine soja]|nr:Fasciclin-like arabinogalactan protein 11 [Glycine soja]
MATGVVNATITSTVYLDNKLAIYEVDKVLLPLDVVLPKPKAPAPSPFKGESPKTKSYTEESGDGNKNSDDDGAVTVNASAGSVNLINNVNLMFVVGLVLMGGAML